MGIPSRITRTGGNQNQADGIDETHAEDFDALEKRRHALIPSKNRGNDRDKEK
jgi:hypothetical protein